ncbi:MAG: dipeptide/oligopeptide/nickel ABC transporter permease/ATP-binding protein [Actinomycetia bacterium]|nr:dipeptide/oligopeptide/nickel ABC transporter permease/ATP-binding protein [Actinomycetes bacterium]
MSELHASEDLAAAEASAPHDALTPQGDDAADKLSQPTKSRFWTRFRRNKLALAAGIFLVLEVLARVFAGLLTTHDPNVAKDFSDFLVAPGGEYWLGTDNVGRDIYTRIVYGTEFAFRAGLIAVTTALVIGIPLGLTIGFFRGWVDRIVMRFVETIVAIPAVVLAIVLIAVTGPGLNQAMFAIGIVYSMIITRLARAEAFAAREELYVDGARAAGASNTRIMFRHMLPNIAPVLIVQTTLLFATAVLAEAALSFLGLGATSQQASWGRMLRDAQLTIDDSIWPAFPPGIAIFVTVVAFNVLGDGLRDAFGREARGGRVGVGDVETAEASDEVENQPDPHALVSIRDLSVRFPRPGTTDDVSVVSGVSFDIAKGEVMALVGESGSGKSISALSILGLVPDPGRASASSIMLDGRELVDLDFDALREVRGKEIGLISQEPSAALNPAYTVGRQISEPLSYHLGLSKSEARQRSIELMTRVGIPNPEVRIDSFPHQFSGGMAQRVVIAMALACGPKLLIADEPTTALDVTVQGQVLDLIGDLSDELGVGVLLITHDLGVVADLAKQVAVMYAGEIVESGLLTEVFHNPQHPYTEGLIKAIPRNESRSGDLPTIDGVVPPPWEWPDGCHFAPRCPYAIEHCTSGTTELRASATSLTRCVRAAELDLIGVADTAPEEIS